MKNGIKPAVPAVRPRAGLGIGPTGARLQQRGLAACKGLKSAIAAGLVLLTGFGGTVLPIGLSSSLAAVPALMISAASAEATERGPVTNLPMPRYVSLKGSEGNARRGPSTSHRIDWVFVRRDMPLQVIGEYDNWRQVRDREGASGWVHYTLLSGVRTVIVDLDMVPLRSSPQDGGAVVAHLQAGVIARLGECTIDWCRVSIDGYKGWLRKTTIWGVDPDETRD